MNESQVRGASSHQYIVKGQYIKDLSFESPHAPHSLLAMATDKPKIDVHVNLRAQKLQEDFFELALNINAKAKADAQTLFMVELSYGGIFQVQKLPQDQLQRLILIECPFVLFPFARRVIADVTRDGGFPPLMLDPIDFHALYEQNKDQLKTAAQA